MTATENYIVCENLNCLTFKVNEIQSGDRQTDGRTDGLTDGQTYGQRSQSNRARFTVRNPNNSNNILISNKRSSLNILMYFHLFFFSPITIVIHFTIIFIHIGVC